MGFIFTLIVTLGVFLFPPQLWSKDIKPIEGGGELKFGYDSNVYQNFSQAEDAFINLGLDLAGSFYPGRGNRLQLAYILDAHWYFQEESERMHQHELLFKFIQRLGARAKLEAGVRGMAHLQPEAPEFGYRKLLPYFVGRFDLPFLFTTKIEYEFKEVIYPDYDLDHQGHFFRLEISREAGLTGEIWLRGGADWAVYEERYVLNASAEPTPEHQKNLLLQAGVGGRVDLGSRVNLALGLDYKHNASNANYYYEGPYGKHNPQVNPELVSNYYRFNEALVNSTLKLWPRPRTELTVGASGGIRAYQDRQARDKADRLKGEKETDLLVKAEGSWRQDLARRKTGIPYWLFRLNLALSSSNDYYSDWWALSASTGAGVDF